MPRLVSTPTVKSCLAELKRAEKDPQLFSRIEHRVQNRRANGNEPNAAALLCAALYDLKLDPVESVVLLQLPVPTIELCKKSVCELRDVAVRVKAIQHVAIQRMRSRLRTIYKSRSLRVMVADLDKRSRQYKAPLPEGMILLSIREAEYLRLLLAGSSGRTLTDSMKITNGLPPSDATRYHRQSLFKKFGVSSVEDLISVCRDIGLCVPGDIAK